MAWFGRGHGRWPGRGPFSYLPPWQRPGWVYGRGACWWLSTSNLAGYAYPSQFAMPYMNPSLSLYNATYQQPGNQTQNFSVGIPSTSSDQELQYLESYRKELDAEMKDLEEEVKGVEARINELKRLLQYKQQKP